MDLSLKAKKMPLSAGVYLFLDKRGQALYVGRAVVLRRRVLNYFQKNIDPRIGEMVARAADIKYRSTANLLEAVILEANLIKKYWPKYNVKEKDNRSFLYLVIPKTDYPRPLIIRQRELAKFSVGSVHIFGPYQSLSLLQNALKIIRRVFPYSTCQPFSGKGCFDYQIKLCPGLCVGAISKEDYQKNIKNIVMLLSGQKKRLLNQLKKENPDKAKSLEHLQDVTLLTRDNIEFPVQKISRIEGYDISHLTGKETYGAMAVFSDGKPDKTQYRLFKIKSAPANDDLRALEEMITRRLGHAEWPAPDLILIDGGKPQVNFIYRMLQKRQINIPLMGLSKYQGDKLIFAPGTKKTTKELAANIKNTLLKTRDEAHRFGLKASRRQRLARK